MFEMILVLTLVNPVSLATAQTAQIQKVEKRLLAPCCYTQSIAEHGSDIAVQMRGEVEAMVTEGKSESEIVEHYRGIYGDRILVVPDGLTGRILFQPACGDCGPRVPCPLCVFPQDAAFRETRAHAKCLAITARGQRRA